MNITNLEIINFRKFIKLKLKNLKLMNIIIGKNGVGKTSIIESIYFGSVSKSFKSYYDEVLIKDSKEFLKVKIDLKDKGKIKKLELILKGKEKKAKINNQVIKKLSDYICQYSVILFSPDDIRLIKDTPNIRRNYLNIQLSNINKEYIFLINNYNKLIKNKNDYLKKINFNRNIDEKYLDIIDQKIVDIGIKIYQYRKKYITEVNEYINLLFKKFKTNDDLYLKYISDFEDKKASELINLLKKNREKEIILGMTNIGIHRDDIEFIQNEKNAEKYSSQGIQKLIILSMKLAEIKVLNNKYNIKPILLLDDLFSELDEINQKKVIKLLNKKFQTFITTTDLNNLNTENFKEVNIIKLKETEEYEK